MVSPDSEELEASAVLDRENVRMGGWEDGRMGGMDGRKAKRQARVGLSLAKAGGRDVG
jgi:hypothetical protein